MPTFPRHRAVGSNRTHSRGRGAGIRGTGGHAGAGARGRARRALIVRRRTAAEAARTAVSTLDVSASATRLDRSPSSAGLPAALHEAARVRGTDRRAGAGVRGERGRNLSFAAERSFAVERRRKRMNEPGALWLDVLAASAASMARTVQGPHAGTRTSRAAAAFPRRRTMPRGFAARVDAAALGCGERGERCCSPWSADGRGGAVSSTSFAATAASIARSAQLRSRRPSLGAAQGRAGSRHGRTRWRRSLRRARPAIDHAASRDGRCGVRELDGLRHACRVNGVPCSSTPAAAFPRRRTRPGGFVRHRALSMDAAARGARQLRRARGSDGARFKPARRHAPSGTPERDKI